MPGSRGGNPQVVVAQFWTYTCINWLRTLPYTRARAEQYRRDGLVTVGVHSPEFEFEKNVENVRRAAMSLKVGYPVAVDSDHAIWRAFNNQYWPALYIADAEGRIRHHQFGEGGSERSEEVIRALLADAGAKPLDRPVGDVTGRGVEAAADWSNLKSPESYLGENRASNFASPDELILGEQRRYTVPSRVKLNQWSLSGEWTVLGGAAVLHSSNGRIVFRFHARDVHLVMGPAARDRTVRFRVLTDGQSPGAAHGSDVDSDGNGLVVDPRIYQLVRQAMGSSDRLFEIEFIGAAVAAFEFTFG